ncbi:GNAT family N-acetyltransferase [Chloroflexus aggregans]|uniref:GCN5-related N-acetyltransferase n=1 Tax=Chloroflexus aggregans (strain MD-66 / DSM 9485) TaxID=326427 RepID=B8G507_CHLAD|nr:GNAT family protein [Chloroflexus aggregans]ACL23640.1 GCN5-related N-acetyltransferase [Chloroflexus aggregans DSM 9485]
MDKTILTTPRLWLRVMAPCDNEAVRGYFYRAWTFGEDWLPIPPADFFTLQGQRRRLAAEETMRATGRNLRLFLVRRDDPFERICGDIWIDCIDRLVYHTALIECRMEERSSRKGLMSEALACVIAYAGQTLGLHRLEALIAPQHHPARRLVERCGFTPLSGVTCWRQIGQGWVEHQVYTITLTSSLLDHGHHR